MTASTSTGSTAVAPSATPTAGSGGTLTIASGAATGALSDRGYDTNAFNALDLIYEPLLRYTDSGFAPGLATSWTISPDGLTVTFTLRSGVLFSDGTAFDASVAKADIDSWRNKDDNSFLGINSDIAATTAADATTLVLTLKSAYYPVLSELALIRPVRIMSPTSFNADGSLKLGVGTGPFVFQSADDQQTVLVRNDRYWGDKPSIDRVVFKVIPDAQARLTALQTGEVDMVGGNYLSPLAPEDVKTLDAAGGITVLTGPGSSNLLLTFNPAKPALTELPVRQAIQESIDRQTISDTLFDKLAVPANAEFPPNIPDAAAGNATPLTFDPAAAKAALDAAGWTGSGTRSKNGTALSLKLVIDPNLFPQVKALSEAIQSELKDIGIEVTITQLDTAAYGDAISKQDYDLAILASFGAPYDPFASLNGQYLSSSDPGSDGRIYRSPELDVLIPKILASTSDAQRTDLYAQLFTVLRGQVATAPLVQQQRIWAVGKRVHGFVLGATDYDLPLTGVTVSG